MCIIRSDGERFGINIHRIMYIIYTYATIVVIMYNFVHKIIVAETDLY